MNEKTMTIKFVKTVDALFEIFEDNRFTHLQNCIKSAKEAKYYKASDTWKVQCVNNYNLDDNIYTNSYDDVNYRWIGGYTESDECVMLQLVHVEEDVIDLINIEKHGNVKNVFGQVIDFVEKTWPGRAITTFPMTDELEAYYMKFGFSHEGDHLVKNRIAVDIDIDCPL